MQAVYKIQNLVNNKVYIGSSVDVEGRFKAHKKSLIDNTHPNHYLQNAWNKYGELNFEFSVIEEVSSNLREREQYYIEQYDATNHSFGYNILPNTNIGLGVSASDEVKKLISQQCSGSKNGHYGKHHSDKTKKQISEKKQEQGKIRRKLLADHWKEEKHKCEVCGIVMETKYASGRFCSKSCVNKYISLRNKQVKHTDDWNNKMRQSLIGKKFSDEHKQKISIARKQWLSNSENNPMYGKYHSEETKRKIAESLRKRRNKNDL